MLANSYNEVIGTDDSFLSRSAFRASWALLTVSGVFCTIGSVSTVRMLMVGYVLWYHAVILCVLQSASGDLHEPMPFIQTWPSIAVRMSSVPCHSYFTRLSYICGQGMQCPTSVVFMQSMCLPHPALLTILCFPSRCTALNCIALLCISFNYSPRPQNTWPPLLICSPV